MPLISQYIVSSFQLRIGTYGLVGKLLGKDFFLIRIADSKLLSEMI
jgi:hypothetical protein